jgi:3-hydroxyisobutyrate dehydrogenase-like beta-hydroxyacid dehydrogenase
VAQPVIGLLHPGEMGSAVGAALRGHGLVLWASAGRSPQTASRAEGAGLSDAGTQEELSKQSDLILSVCPPHAALDVARSVAGFEGTFVDANAVSSATAREISAVIEAGGGRFVDGGIIGPLPREDGSTRLYLSGPSAEGVAELFAGSALEACVVSKEPGDASALKMAYAAWTKGTAALLLAVRALARAEGVEDSLLDEWRRSLPELPERSLAAARSAGKKGWRWVGEMEEIASTFASADLPDGFHRAAAEVFRRSPRLADSADAVLDEVLRAIATAEVR